MSKKPQYLIAAYFFSIFFLLDLFESSAQLAESNGSRHYVDSIYLIMDSLTSDEKKVRYAVDIAIYEQDLDKKLLLLRRLNSTLFDIQDSTRSKIWYELSLSHLGTGFLDSSSFFARKLLDASKKYGDVIGQLSAYNVEAHIASQRGDFEMAIEKYFVALKVMEKYEGERKLENKASILGNLSGVFFYLDDYESARKYVAQELEIGRALGNLENISFALVRMGIMEEKLGNYDASIKSGLEAEKTLFQIKPSNETLLTNCYSVLGSSYIGKGQWSKAKSYLEKGITLCRKNRDLTNLFDLLREQSRVYIALGNHSRAGQLADEAFSLINLNGGYGDLQSALEAKIDVAKAKGQYKSALDLYMQLVLHKDSITNLEAKKKIAELQTEFETERKEAEISRLSLKNDLQAANLASARNLQFAIGICAVMAVLLLAVYFTQRNKKLNAEREAQEQQYDALQKRYIELLNGPQTFALADDIEALNRKVVNPLTEREFEALSLGLQGKSNKEIAEKLFISESTVKFHLRNVYNKLGVVNRKEALEYVVKKT